MTPSPGATALDLLSTLAAPRPDDGGADDIIARPRTAHWCPRCGAPRNLGQRDCPGCRLLEEARERIAGYLARHGMPVGGAVELARLADVPLRAVGELMTGAPARPRPRRPG